MQKNLVDVESDVQSDLAVYGQNVFILATDNDAAETTAAFKGLVYAEHSPFMLGDSNLGVEGALVARQGHVYLIAGTAKVSANPWSITKIERRKDLKVTYNPDYLDSLLNPATQKRTKVELLAWRPGRDK